MKLEPLETVYETKDRAKTCVINAMTVISSGAFSRTDWKITSLFATHKIWREKIKNYKIKK